MYTPEVYIWDIYYLKMKLLAYDTSSDILSIALSEDGRLIAEEAFPRFVNNSAQLAPCLQKFLRRNKIRLSDVDVLAVGLGPGSFTGLRVGITSAKVLTYSLKKKLVGVPSLEAIARSVEGYDGEVACLLDAKKGKVYSAIYRQNGHSWSEIQKPAVTDRDVFLSKIRKRTYFVPPGVYPSASRIAQGAWERVKKKRFTDPFRLQPLYLHPRDCHVVRR